MPADGVLVMAYGTPAGLDDVDAYYTDIRGGRPPSTEQLAELIERYRAIGGRSPLLEITRAQVAGLEARLKRAMVYLGQKHASPSIGDAVARMNHDGIERAAGLVLAPHYSSMSVGDYERRALQAAEAAGWRGKLEMIQSWHLEPGYVELLADRARDALERLPEDSRSDAPVLFTAHSLPARIVEMGDPYPEQLRETAEAVATRAGLARWDVAWQSAGRTSEPWLGPDVSDVVRKLADEGVRGVVVCPCGFVADHLEVLYDIDVEAAQVARELGLALVRTASPNDDDAFLDMLAAVVTRRLYRQE